MPGYDCLVFQSFFAVQCRQRRRSAADSVAINHVMDSLRKFFSPPKTSSCLELEIMNIRAKVIMVCSYTETKELS